VGIDAKVSLISGHGSIEGVGVLSGMAKTVFNLYAIEPE